MPAAQQDNGRPNLIARAVDPLLQLGDAGVQHLLPELLVRAGRATLGPVLQALLARGLLLRGVRGSRGGVGGGSLVT